MAVFGGLVSGSWLAGTALEGLGRWFDFYATNQYSAATFGATVSVAVVFAVSKLTAPLPEGHVRRLFDTAEATES